MSKAGKPGRTGRPARKPAHKVRYPVSGVEQAPAASTMRIRTRLRYSMADMVVLVALAEHFDRLQGRDLAVRCKGIPDEANAICALAGYIGVLVGKYRAPGEKVPEGTKTGQARHVKPRPPSAETVLWGIRKQDLTPECSSRWAGWITKSSNNAYVLAQRNQARTLADKNKAIAVLSAKLALPVRSAAERKDLLEKEREAAKAECRRGQHLSFGYRSTSEHAMKRRRLEHLRTEARALEADIASGRVHVTRGGKALLRNRLHLDEAGITEDEWQQRWRAKRWSFGANGEARKQYGNETIRVSPDGTLEMDLPPALAHMANVTTRGVTRYRFDAKVSFSYRQDDWLSQVEANRAVAYNVMFGERGRVYLDASFTAATSPAVPALSDLLADPGLRVLSLDLNNGFLAPAVLDHSGNPIHRLAHIPLLTEDLPATTRDGHLRRALTEALDLAERCGCKLVVVEHLGFSDMRATGREDFGSRKWFRKIVCGMPTAQVSDRLVPMASRRGIAVAGVPAAYSSIWGKAYWQRPLSSEQHKVSGHTAAAVVLGRRALGHPARRRSRATPDVTAPDQKVEPGIEAAEVSEHTSSTAGVVSYHVGTSESPGNRHHHATSKPLRHKGVPVKGHKTRTGNVGLRGARPAKTVRAGPRSTVLSATS